jgi:DNA-binding MarR family transcriptional regulator
MWHFLQALSEEDGITHRTLSEKTGTMESTTNTQVRRMEARGLLKRIRDIEDRRNIRIFLTPKGRALHKELVIEAAEISNSALKGLGSREVKSLRKSLVLMRANLIRYEEGLSSRTATKGRK